MTKEIINIVILFISINLSTVHGQTEDFSREENIDSTRLFLGISTGYQNVIHKDARYQMGDEYCPMNIPSAYGNGYYVGVNLKYALFTEPFAFSFISLKLLYENKTAESENNYLNIIVYDPVKEWDTVGTTMYADMSISYITIVFQYSSKLSESFPLSICAGPTVSFFTASNFLQIWNMISDNPSHRFPKNPKYEYFNNDKSVIAYDKEIQNTNNIIPGIQFGLSYECSITDKIQLLPEIYYTWNLMHVVNNHSWNMSSINAGISLLYAID
ncbi:MAG: hypothetical protein V1779_16025 [bacterium]